jgi:hypothetical protein
MNRLPRAVAVGIFVIAVGVVGCARTTPIVAPTVVVVDGVDAQQQLASTEATNAQGSWHAKQEVDVKWRGTWFPAVILERRGARWLVHYDGYSDEWDELVPDERIRKREVKIEPPDDDDPDDSDP